jgi:AcrR family transcriptional regulator
MGTGRRQERVVTTNSSKREAGMRKRPEQRQAADFDQRIVRVARQLFAERGIEDVSMHQIAQEAGVGQGTLYRRYAHKGELILDLLNESAQRFLEEIQAYAQDGEIWSALQRLDSVLHRCIAFIEEEGLFLAAIMDTSSAEKREMKFSTRYYRASHSLIAHLLEEAITQEELAPLDTIYTADAIIATSDPALYLFQRQRRGYTPEQILEGIRRIYIKGVSVRSPRNQARDDQPEPPTA